MISTGILTLALGFVAGYVLRGGKTRRTLERLSRDYDALEKRLCPAGYAIVPIAPTAEMVEAGAAADWVGDVEGRAGCSILPDTEMEWDDDRQDYVEVKRPGIWQAMLDNIPAIDPEGGPDQRP